MISNWTKLGLAAAALLVAPMAAEAADMPRPVYKAHRSVVAYYNWTGWYAGINGGYGWGDSEWTSGPTSTGNFDVSGGLLGATLGYNYQTGAFVWGLETDLAWSNIKGATDATNVFCASCETSNSWLGTFRGRFGYAFDRWLPYFTAGLAYGDVKASSALGSDSSMQTGWTAGVGLEYAFMSNWTAKLEYLFVDLGSGDCIAACGAPGEVKFTTNIVRLGLNYKFSGPIFSRW